MQRLSFWYFFLSRRPIICPKSSNESKSLSKEAGQPRCNKLSHKLRFQTLARTKGLKSKSKCSFGTSRRWCLGLRITATSIRVTKIHIKVTEIDILGYRFSQRLDSIISEVFSHPKCFFHSSSAEQIRTHLFPLKYLISYSSQYSCFFPLF